MPQIDQFESVFRAAIKDPFQNTAISLKKILVVTDLDPEKAQNFLERTKQWLAHADNINTPRWEVVTADDYQSAEDLLGIVREAAPELICTYRNLLSTAWRYPYSLGVHLDVLLQETPMPVMVMPHPQAGFEAEHALSSLTRVMVLTDHLLANHCLINFAEALIEKDGTLYLVHIEDQHDFDRYINAISKIETLDTDIARQRIHDQLLKEPKDYIHSIHENFKERQVAVNIESLVVFGRSLHDLKKLIETWQLNLLVMNVKDENQMAMHGKIYPLVVELRQIPLLLI